jgi:cobalt-zinc-cadmium efflux system membrane fusion protein
MTLVAVAVVSSLATWLYLETGHEHGLEEDAHADGHADEHEHAEEEIARGPNGGRLLDDGNFSIELVVAEAGIPPEFHAYAYNNGAPLPAGEFAVSVELERLGGIRDSFEFVPENSYRRGIGVVSEPHSFDVSVTARFGEKTFAWEFESHEGRTVIPQRIAQESGLVTEAASAQRIVETVELTGNVQPNPANVAEVRARFPGVVRDIRRDTGAIVSRGERLATVEANESLRQVPVSAPIDGLIVARDIQVGQVTGEQPLFVIVDLSEVWVQLDVFGRDLAAVSPGQRVSLTTLDGVRYQGVIDWISPLVAHGSQSVRARVPLDNSDGSLRAGQFISASVVVDDSEVPLAVKPGALQTFREFDVVYAQVGETYEVRMLELGRRDNHYVEVIGGLSQGEVYVAENSFLVKADIEKSGASHDH